MSVPVELHTSIENDTIPTEPHGVTVFDGRRPDLRVVHNEQRIPALTATERDVLLVRIKGAVDPLGYENQTALTQAAVEAVTTGQLRLSTLVKDHNIIRGKLLYEDEAQAFDAVVDGRDEDEEQNTTASLASGHEVLGGATQAESALLYLAYKRHMQLTPAELNVLNHFNNTYDRYPDIAAALQISPATVKAHVRSIFQKLGVSKRQEVIDFYTSSEELLNDPIDYRRDREQDSSPDVTSNTLTVAERNVLPLLLLGLTITDMAANLHISPNTVKTHVSAIYRKVGVSGRTGRDNFQKLTRAVETPPVVQQDIVLTDAELTLLQYVLAGCTLKEIAALYGRSVNTIKTHLQTIYGKAGIKGMKDHERHIVLKQVFQDEHSKRETPTVIYSAK